MLPEGPIPQAVQGLLEYLAGALFVAAPFLFGLTSVAAATAASIVLGLLFLVIAATSAGPTGLVKQLPPVVHVLFDVVIALLLIAAQFVLGFSSVSPPRNLFLVAGVVWLLITIGSQDGRQPRSAAPPSAPAQLPTPRGSPRPVRQLTLRPPSVRQPVRHRASSGTLDNRHVASF